MSTHIELNPKLKQLFSRTSPFRSTSGNDKVYWHWWNISDNRNKCTDSGNDTSTDTSVEDKSTVMGGKKSTGIGGNDVY